VLRKDDGLIRSRKLLLARCLAWVGLLHDFTDSPKNEYFSEALAIWTRWIDKLIHDPKEENRDGMIEVAHFLGTLFQFFSLITRTLE
jgi:hypothetical protein